MNDTLCSNFDYLRNYLPDELSDNPKLELKSIKNYNNYCPNDNCNTDLDKITVGFLWLLGECYSALKNKVHENSINAFFIYLISWLSYKLNQNLGHGFIKINDFYTNSVMNSGKYSKFTTEAYRFSGIDEFIDKQSDFLNINIEDMSKFYDVFKLLCSMHGNLATNKNDDALFNANDFVKNYARLKNDHNIEGAAGSKILPVLSTGYNNLKAKCKNCPSLPETEAEISALASEYISSSSSIGSKFFTVLSIFGAIAFFLGISYKVNNKELKKNYYIYANINKQPYT
ncbi:hypothetical protein YYC_05827 [Plasmodium yoelii 17X]|uniref:Uncharacterized protein n=1 Tax=Plasmodium yoelii 17X TaxID=1323249 RepID=V7PDG8_PLAYE|nr:hypothetical protein YYC_05827 [Plasmodium yoelii 17X]